ncbi:SGNH/GDSL hydrolase family protein [Kitasatospora kazusensis]|uniref:SGNH/GDSL hydrolase family protein n=1 Tax=Kitasatospora kazusensis TaxID=407974 RepID=A0ABP5LCT5_9ACTN
MLSPALKRTSTLVSGVVLAAALTALSTPAAQASTSATHASAHAVDAGNYVALGDSYAAGAGVPGQSAGLCLRSDHNYGHLVAAALGSSSYTDVTCAAAKIKSITSAQYDAFIRVNDPQLNAVGPSTTLITLGIGGNDLGTSDLGIADVIAACVSGAVIDPFGTPCHNYYGHKYFNWSDWAWEYGDDTLVDRIDAAAPQLADTLQQIHAKAPNARVVVVGYPEVLPADASSCAGRQPITVGDVSYLHGILGKVNSMLADTSAANGATFVDTTAATTGHDVCSDDRWIEGALPGSPAVPFHPNATGERAMADAVLAALGH